MPVNVTPCNSLAARDHSGQEVGNVMTNGAENGAELGTAVVEGRKEGSAVVGVLVLTMESVLLVTALMSQKDNPISSTWISLLLINKQ